MCKRIPVFVAATALFLAVAAGAFAERRVAFLDINNLDTTPRYDYLQGIIKGLLLYDLSRIEGVALVERSQLSKILEEQALQLSDLMENDKKSMEIGGLLKADHLLKGEYIYIGPDVMITVRLIVVETGRVMAFTRRGANENAVHALAEELASALTGKKTAFQNDAGNRSIISMQDETPGTLLLHSPMINAEIFLDDRFIGYTKGNRNEAILIEKVPPGKHVLRVHLGSGFGVVKFPEVTFGDWQVELIVEPGKKYVLRDETRDFNSQIYAKMRVFEKTDNVEPSTAAKAGGAYETSFVDRAGKTIPIKLKTSYEYKDGILLVRLSIDYDGKVGELALSSRKDAEAADKVAIGKVKVNLRVTNRYGGGHRVEVDVWRTDIEQGMYDEESGR